MMFDTAAISGIIASLPKTTAVGIRTPFWSGEEPQAQRERFFYALLSSNGRPGGRSRKARRCSIGSSNSRFGRPPSLERGLAVQNRNWSNIMSHDTLCASAPIFTSKTPFPFFEQDGNYLFTTFPEANAATAVDHICCLLSSAKWLEDLPLEFSENNVSSKGYVTRFLLDAAYALLATTPYPNSTVSKGAEA